MGYSITIGNAEMVGSFPRADSVDYDEPYAKWAVGGKSHPEAPDCPDITGNGNSRHPSYTQWHDFARRVGLHDLFFNKENGLLHSHPGCQRLTVVHLRLMEGAQTMYKAANPDKVFGWCRCAACDDFPQKDPTIPRPPHDPTLDYDLVRLEWLVWWTRWALANCERPAISNT